MQLKSYREMLQHQSFDDRFEYLKLGGFVGQSTFGFDRYINQEFYRSTEWRYIRNHVISRDNGCDLGVRGYEINGSVLVHHINPMDSDDIIHGEEWILNPDYLITTTHGTHNAIHYGNRALLPKVMIERRPGDTRMW